MKRSVIGVVAAASLGLCLWTLLVATRNALVGGIHLHGLKQAVIYFAGLGMIVWLAWLSVRGLRIALGMIPLSGPRLRMWRIFLGVLFLFYGTRTIVDPASNRYQADNLAEAIGMYGAWVIMCGFAVWLIPSAFPRWQKAAISD